MMLRWLLAISLLTPSFSAFAAAPEPTKEPAKATEPAVVAPPIKPSDLEGFFNAPLARRSNSEAYFGLNYQNPIATAQLNATIAASEKLQAQAIAGRQFRIQFYEQARLIFGAENVGLALSPYYTATKWLQSLANSVNRKTEVQISEQEARLRAVEATVTRFGLPGHYTAGDIEKYQYQDNQHRQAFDYYSRHFYLLMEETRRANNPVDLSIEQFKQRLTDRIQKLRIANFLFAVRQYEAFSGQKVQYIRHDLGAAAAFDSFNFSDLEIQTPSQFASNAQFKKPRRWWHGLPHRLGLMVNKFDAAYSKKYYGPNHFYPTRPISSLVASSGANKSLAPAVFRETEILNLLNQFREDPRLENAKEIENNFLYEAAARDVILNNFLLNLTSEKDVSFEGLCARLQEKLKYKPLAANQYSISYQLLNYFEDQTRDDAATNLRWSGYKSSTDYWNLRDAAAKAAKMPEQTPAAFNPSGEVNPKPVKLKRKQRKIEKNEIRAGPIRAETNAERTKSLGKLTSKKIAKAAAIALLINGGVSSSDQIKNLIHQSIPLSPAQASQILSHLPQFMQTLFEELRFNVAPPIGMDDLSQAVNHRIPHNRRSRSINQQEGAAVFDIKIGELKEGERVPYYFDIITRNNLKDLRSMPFKPLSDKATAFTLTSLTGGFAENNILPIPTPFRYVPTNIKLMSGGEALREGVDFNLNIEPNDGLLFITLQGKWAEKTSAITKFTYEINYAKNDLVVTDPVDRTLINETALDATVKELEGIRAAQTVNYIRKEVDWVKTQKFDLEFYRVVEAFEQSGFYNWSGYIGTPSPDLDANNPFYDFAKFLHGSEFWYQCTGSNLLFNKFYSRYLENAKKLGVDSPVKLEAVQGFVYEGNGKITTPGHFHNIAYRLDSDFSYSIADVTPAHSLPVDDSDIESKPSGPSVFEPYLEAIKKQFEAAKSGMSDFKEWVLNNITNGILASPEPDKAQSQRGPSKAVASAPAPYQPDLVALPNRIENPRTRAVMNTPTLYLPDAKRPPAQLIVVVSSERSALAQAKQAEIAQPFQKQIDAILAARLNLTNLLGESGARYPLLQNPQRFAVLAGLNVLARSQLVIELLRNEKSDSATLFRLFLVTKKIRVDRPLSATGEAELQNEFADWQATQGLSLTDPTKRLGIYNTLSQQIATGLDQTITAVSSGEKSVSGLEFLLESDIVGAIRTLDKEMSVAVSVALEPSCAKILK